MITRENYREYPAINYSKLSSLDRDVTKVNEDKDFSDGIRNGDILDILCFDGQEAFEKKYFVSTLNNLPSDAVRSIIDSLEQYDDDSILQKARLFEYQNRWKDETLVAHIKKEGDAYIGQLMEAGDKIIIDLQTYTTMINAVNMLKESDRSKMFFVGSEFQKPFSATIWVQAAAVDVEYKCLCDIFADEKDHIIVGDLKYTSYPLKSFEYEFLRWRYDIQASLYSKIVETIYKKPVMYYNIVYSSADNAVMRFSVNYTTRRYARTGGFARNGKYYKGWEELTKELLWHEKHNLWDLPYEIYVNSELEINPFREVSDNGSLITRR